MSVESPDGAGDPARAAMLLLDAADARAAAALASAVDDFFLLDAGRLDDETRADVGAVIRLIVADVVASLSERLPEAVDVSPERIAARLARAGLLRDGDMMGELIGRVRQSRIAARLPAAIGEGEASLLMRLADCPDAEVVSAARALLLAEVRRRAGEGGTELPAELHHQLVWWVAAAVEEMAEVPGADQDVARAARAVIAAHDEGERVEAHAARLAAAIDARPAEFGELLMAALGDGRLSLFIAVIARAAGAAFEDIRQAVLEPGGDRLWMLLRAQGARRETVVEIGVLLAAADRRRDVHRLADAVDAAFAVDIAAAERAVATLRMPRDFRHARRALAVAA